MDLTIFTDGGCRKSRNVAGCAAVILKEDGTSDTRAESFPYVTNNVAEYRGLLLGLAYALEQQAGNVKVFMDSELVVRQVLGQYAVNEAGLKPLHQRAVAMSRRIRIFSLQHVHREFNTLADAAVNRIIDAYLGGK